MLKIINKYYRPDTRLYLFTSLFYSCIIIYFCISSAAFPVMDFAGRIFSQASSENISIAGREFLYYKGLLVFLCSFPLFFLLLSRLDRFISKTEKEILNYISAAGIFFLALQVYTGSFSASLFLIYMLHITLAGGGLIKRILRIPAGKDYGPEFYAWILCCIFFLFFFFKDTLYFCDYFFVPSLPLFLPVCGLLIFLAVLFPERRGGSGTPLFPAAINVLRPVALFPLWSFISRECYMILNNHGIYFFNPSGIYISGAVIIIWLVARKYKRGKKAEVPRTETIQQLKLYYFPLLVAGMTVCQYYAPVIVPSQELFETANPALATEQLHDFGKIPFLHSFNTHGLADTLHAFIYNMLNGYHGLEYDVYWFFPIAALTLLAYYVLASFTGNPYVAVFTILFSPFVFIYFPSGFDIALASVFVLAGVLKKQSVRNYMLLFISIVLLSLWRYDTAVPNILACVAVIFTFRYAREGFVLDFSSILKGMAAAAGVFALLLLSASILFRTDFLRGAADLWHFFLSDQAYGIKKLNDPAFTGDNTHLYIFPLAVTLLLAYAFYISVKEKTASGITAFTVLFFTGFYYLANYPGGLVRNTLITSGDTSLSSFVFFLLAGSVYLFFRHKPQLNRFLFFTAASCLLIYNYKSPREAIPSSNCYQDIITRPDSALFILPANYKIDRAPISEDFEIACYREFAHFMDEHFRPEETFLDFSNTPMLYFYTHRVNPGFFNQPLLSCHDDYLQNRFLEGLKKYKIPVVVFSNFPLSFWDSIDGVPNTTRHYRIAEYIYRHYRPYAIMNGRCIWISKALKGYAETADTLFTFRGLRDTLTQTELYHAFVADSDSVIIRASDVSPSIKGFPGRDSSIALQPGKNNYLIMKAHTEPENARVSFVFNDLSSLDKPLLFSEEGFSCTRIDNTENQRRLNDIIIHIPEKGSLTIEDIGVIAGSHLPDFYSGLHAEKYELKYLPFIWAKYDKAFTRRKIRVLQTITKDTAVVAAGLERKYVFNPVDDKESGNYILLRIRSLDNYPFDLKLAYGTADSVKGSLTFTMVPGSRQADYLVRVSSLYNWYSNNNNRLYLTPLQGGNIEVTSIRVLKGD